MPPIKETPAENEADAERGGARRWRDRVLLARFEHGGAVLREPGLVPCFPVVATGPRGGELPPPVTPSPDPSDGTAHHSLLPRQVARGPTLRKN